MSIWTPGNTARWLAALRRRGFMADRPADGLGESSFAQGGYVSTPPQGQLGAPIMISRGYALMSYGSYRALSPSALRELFPNTDFEVVLTSAEVRELGPAGWARLQRDLYGGDDGL